MGSHRSQPQHISGSLYAASSSPEDLSTAKVSKWIPLGGAGIRQPTNNAVVCRSSNTYTKPIILLRFTFGTLRPGFQPASHLSTPHLDINKTLIPPCPTPFGQNKISKYLAAKNNYETNATIFGLPGVFWGICAAHPHERQLSRPI